jgi:hypothetical protein
MKIKKIAGKGKGKRQTRKTAAAMPVFFPIFPFSSLFLSLLPPFPSPAEPEKK